MTELIITEKPSSAKKIAFALADSEAKKESFKQVPYYRLKHENRDIIVSSAVGHLYTIGEKEKTPWSKFPVFDVEWIPTYKADKSAEFSKKYLDTIKMLSKEAKTYTIACDYDIEGEVIGLNIIRKICEADDASRMKFSTLTKKDLLEAYRLKSPTLDWGQANAGETRHILDFYYGINLTRALTDAINKVINGFKVLSSGRVQGPALKIIAMREKEIRAFNPVPYWQVELNGIIGDKGITGMHKIEKFWDKEQSDAVMEKVRGAKEGKISKADKKRFNQNPPVPFDLTSLQIEAYRCFKIKPKHTLDIAQTLYSSGYISYPRTSSQKLPKQLGFKNIILQLKKQDIYTVLAENILKTKLIPNEGKKKDDAHPAIYPTGNEPTGIDEREFKIYDLIVKRFFSVFAEPAKRETNSLVIDVNSEEFIAKGTTTVYRGWHDFYAPYVKLDNVEMPIVNIGDIVKIKKIEQLAKETKPPKRYTQSSIINALEKKDLGTKATRATIIETLFTRGYVVGENNIEATELGIKTVDTLEKYCPRIIDEKLTLHFEVEMEKIRKGKKKGETVLHEAHDILNEIIDTFRKNEKQIGTELSEANQEAIKVATTLGKCSVCKTGDIVIRKGKYGRFAACNNYPDCTNTYNLPNKGTIKPTDKACEVCNAPIVRFRQPKKSPLEICINPECPTKSAANGSAANGGPDASEQLSYPEEGMQCPNCANGKMILRKSFYGVFLGCDQYPSCKTMMRIIDGKVDTTPISPVTKKKKKKKTAKKKKAVKKTKKKKKKTAKKKKTSKKK